MKLIAKKVKKILWYVPQEVQEYDSCLACDYYVIEEPIGAISPSVNYSFYEFENGYECTAPRNPKNTDKDYWIKCLEWKENVYYD